MQFDFPTFLLYHNKNCKPKGGRFPLDFFVIGESTPVQVLYELLTAQFYRFIF
jgi:hypothetical protein